MNFKYSGSFTGNCRVCGGEQKLEQLENATAFYSQTIEKLWACPKCGLMYRTRHWAPFRECEEGK